MPGMPVGISVYPSRTYSDHAWVQVKDIASGPVKVTWSTVVLHSGCKASRASGTVRPATLTHPHGHPRWILDNATSIILHPGQLRWVYATVPQAKGDFGVLFQAQALNARGNVMIGAVGSQLITRGAMSCVHSAVRLASRSPFPMTPLLISLAIGAMLLAVLALTLRRQYRRARRT